VYPLAEEGNEALAGDADALLPNDSKAAATAPAFERVPALAADDPNPPSAAPFLRRRVLGQLGAPGRSPEGHPRDYWKPGDVGDFRPHIVEGLPEFFEEV
jgi:hypothetical protein